LGQPLGARRILPEVGVVQLALKGLDAVLF
jgi:hypothetical protein